MTESVSSIYPWASYRTQKDPRNPNLVEVGGIEPPSEFNVKPSSTCVVSLLFLALTAAG